MNQSEKIPPVSHDSEVMPKIDLQKDADRLKYMQFILMKRAEAENIERARQYTKNRRGCAIFGCSLAAGAIGIYLYSMYAIKQESFLDDFNEPEKVLKGASS